MPTDIPEEARRFLADCNLARHGWASFQDGARRATERLARKSLDLTEQHTSNRQESHMDAHARIHAMLNLDQPAREQLDALLREERKGTVEFVLYAVEQAAGDDTAEHVKDSSPTLQAWLDGRDAD